MRKKVLLTRPIHDFALRELKKKYRVVVHNGVAPIPARTLKTQIADAYGLVCFPYDSITQDVMDSAKNLKVISAFSVGLDHIDIKYAKERKIRVGYTPNVLTDSTADMAFALLLDVTKRVTEGDRVIRNGRWRQVYGPTDYLGVDLQGKTLGILGMGRIGSTVARRAQAFDVKVAYHNTRRLPRDREHALQVRYRSFDRLIAESDFISIHVPHTEQTDSLFDRNVFARMKDTAFLINTARGKIVNQRDLADALRKGVIAGAGLDVFEDEPIGHKGNPLAKLDNVVLAPHIGSATKETRDKMAQIVIRNLKLGLDAKKPVYSAGY